MKLVVILVLIWGVVLGRMQYLQVWRMVDLEHQFQLRPIHQMSSYVAMCKSRYSPLDIFLGQKTNYKDSKLPRMCLRLLV